MRRLGDLIIACALLSLTFPLMAFVALAIRCESPGPIFERQVRVSSDGRRFKRLTFRTRAHDPKNVRPVWARQPTRVGAFIRYARIEDLPQLINVLRGEISVIDAGATPNAFWD
jgi:putative colanic acid biosynthesis UDP-glucose lipid carrier transferase